jgi:hypothetical protein
MDGDEKERDFVSFKSKDVLHAAQSLIAVSSIIQATADQYAHTGQLAVGALVHAGNVVDNTIERLGLADLVIERPFPPF